MDNDKFLPRTMFGWCDFSFCNSSFSFITLWMASVSTQSYGLYNNKVYINIFLFFSFFLNHTLLNFLVYCTVNRYIYLVLHPTWKWEKINKILLHEMYRLHRKIEKNTNTFSNTKCRQNCNWQIKGRILCF